MVSNLPVVSLLLIKWKPVFIDKFDLGIGKEWLPHVSLANEGTTNAPINFIPHLPLSWHDRGNSGLYILKKSNSPPMGEQLVVKSSYSSYGYTFKNRLVRSLDLNKYLN